MKQELQLQNYFYEMCASEVYTAEAIGPNACYICLH
jgi:hypothetical protein